MDVPGQCANCPVPLLPDQPAGLHYCPKGAAAWQRGNASRTEARSLTSTLYPMVYS